MPDPYRARSGSKRRRGGGERVTRQEAFSDRLRRLGATDDEVRSFEAHWDENPDERDAVLALSDEDLARAIGETRAEWLVGSGDPVETAVEIIRGIYEKWDETDVDLEALAEMVGRYLDDGDPEILFADHGVDVPRIDGDDGATDRLLAIRDWAVAEHEREDEPVDALTGVPTPTEKPDGYDDWTVGQVTEWVGTDPARAAAVRTIEANGKDRKGVIEYLDGLDA